MFFHGQFLLKLHMFGSQLCILAGCTGWWRALLLAHRPAVRMFSTGAMRLGGVTHKRPLMAAGFHSKETSPKAGTGWNCGATRAAAQLQAGPTRAQVPQRCHQRGGYRLRGRQAGMMVLLFILGTRRMRKRWIAQGGKPDLRNKIKTNKCALAGSIHIQSKLHVGLQIYRFDTRSSVQASVPIERVESRGCPTGSTRFFASFFTR